MKAKELLNLMKDEATVTKKPYLAILTLKGVQVSSQDLLELVAYVRELEKNQKES